MFGVNSTETLAAWVRVNEQVLPAKYVRIRADSGRTRQPVAVPASLCTSTFTGPAKENEVQEVSFSRLVSVLRAATW